VNAYFLCKALISLLLRCSVLFELPFLINSSEARVTAPITWRQTVGYRRRYPDG
jgi:hypothetical protein